MPNDTYKAGSENSRSAKYEYNPKTGAWEPITAITNSSSNGSSSKPNGATSKPNSNSASADSSSKVNSQAKADSEYIEIEFNTLEGELNVISSKKTLPIKPGHTIDLRGVGKYLSGLYYISGVKRTLDTSSGYTHTLSVIKTGFGPSLKDSGSGNSSDTSRPSKSENTSSGEFKVGDKVKFLTVASNKYTYSNAHEGTPVPKWVTEKVHTVDAVSSDGQRVRLKEIWSWTYVKFLKKV